MTVLAGKNGAPGRNAPISMKIRGLFVGRSFALGKSVEKLSDLQIEAAQFARQSGLRYVTDNELGYTRKRLGQGFIYLNQKSQQRLKSKKELLRIRSLVIPPAWRDVWICAHPNGHLQVTGRDQRRRKQYKYHPQWSQSRNDDKFAKLKIFAKVLPQIRARVKKDLRLKGLPREKVLAAVVRLMELGHMRVGNDEYARENKSYGLTTLRNQHAQVSRMRVRFKYRGKSGVERDVSIEDPDLCKIVRGCQELPGQELFAYLDENDQVHDVGSADVNDYLKEISGENITAKDFRTWGGTVKAIEKLLELGENPNPSKTSAKRREVEVIRCVATHLGNTVAVCRKYYVSPQVFEADRKGLLLKISQKRYSRRGGYSKCERCLMDVMARK